MSVLTIKEVSMKEAKNMGIDSWEPYQHGPIKKEWAVQEQETAYFLEGEVIVTVEGVRYELKENMLVSFPKGIVCTWEIPVFVKKVFKKGYVI